MYRRDSQTLKRTIKSKFILLPFQQVELIPFCYLTYNLNKSEINHNMFPLLTHIHIVRFVLLWSDFLSFNYTLFKISVRFPNKTLLSKNLLQIYLQLKKTKYSHYFNEPYKFRIHSEFLSDQVRFLKMYL